MSRNHPWYQDNPVGDPFGGPAYGKYEDPQTLGMISSGLGAYLGYSGAQGAAGQLVGASNAANATLGALTGQGIGALNTSTDLAAQLSNPSRQTGNYAQQALAAALGLPQQAMGPTNLPGGGTLQGTNQLGPLSGSLASALTPFTYGADQFQSSPGYQFALQQGLNTIQNNAAAKGMLLSPNTIKDLSTYATGVANQDYQQQYQNAYQAYTQNQSNVLNTLGSLMGQGNAATNNLTSNITNAGSNISNLLSSLGVAQANNQLGAGSAAAAGRVGATNALTGGLGNISNLLSAGRYLGQTGNLFQGAGSLISDFSPGLAGSIGDTLGMSIGGTYGTATQAGLDSLISSLLSEGSGAAAAGAGTAGAGAAAGAAGTAAESGLGGLSGALGAIGPAAMAVTAPLAIGSLVDTLFPGPTTSDTMNSQAGRGLSTENLGDPYSAGGNTEWVSQILGNTDTTAAQKQAFLNNLIANKGMVGLNQRLGAGQANYSSMDPNLFNDPRNMYGYNLDAGALNNMFSMMQNYINDPTLWQAAAAYTPQVGYNWKA